MVSSGDIVGKIGSIVQIDSSISAGDLAIMVENAKVHVENMTGQGVNLADIGSSFQGPLVNLGAAFALSKQTGIGVDFSYRIGNFQVDKGKANDPNSTQLQFLLEQANLQIATIGRPIRFGKVTPTV